jgi:nuclear GTP-binding protein
MDIVPSISTLAAMAGAAEVVEIEQSNDTPELRAARVQKKQYIRTLHKVVDQSDIVIMVLDARDPEGCRSRMVEDEVRRREADGKRLIFVLNKIGEPTSFLLAIDLILLTADLVPKENAQGWLKYLRHTAPTLPFRSSTQLQRQNLSSRTSPALLNLLKSFKPPNRSISVGVVGYPNVGKSSLINSLKRARVSQQTLGVHP